MISFQPDVCLPKDPEGFGLWLTGHYREHVQMKHLCLTLAPAVFVPDYDILGWKDEPQFVQQWLVAHEQIHQFLRTACRVTGSDLSLVDFSQDDEFLEWQEDHALEHQQFRTFLGIK